MPSSSFIGAPDTTSAPVVAAVPANTTAIVPVSPAPMQYVPSTYETAGFITGAVGGGLLFPKHRVLGVLGGAVLGSSLPDLLKPETRVDAACRIGTAGAATLGSLYISPIFGYVLGALLGAAATTLVPGSSAHDSLASLRQRMGLGKATA